ncbi:DedA family protein [Streptomyces sp. NBC_01304]|uniref:DedA family protein n=1 Tax=Streptomyces sp. NBC_01304 TaxID=2903818 RepID=UPI002E134FC1|nr:DedA family protein [Streptomyces sp. NBC_01304]
MVDASALLSGFGTIGVFVVLFLEAGTLLGVVLPGGAVLFTAGMLCSAGEGHLSLPLILLCGVLGTVLGAQTSYWIGRRTGPGLLARLRKERLRQGVARVQELLERYGPGPALLVARFIPVVRTLSSRVAGALLVPGRTFAVWQSAAGAVWATAMTFCGYLLGAVLPGADAYLVLAGVVVLALVVTSLVRRHRGTRRP